MMSHRTLMEQTARSTGARDTGFGCKGLRGNQPSSAQVGAVCILASGRDDKSPLGADTKKSMSETLRLNSSGTVNLRE